MKIQYLKQSVAAILVALIASSAIGQGVLIYKKDGSKVKIPYENFDRMESYNYDEIITEEYSVGGIAIKMIKVDGGTFLMGAQTTDSTKENYDYEAGSGESPVHQVTLDGFYIGETEVTQGLWEAVMSYTGLCADGSTMSAYASDVWLGDNPSSADGLGSNYPAYYVSYDDIVDIFLPRLNKITGASFRLPTEAEWEYAARGGNKSQGYKYSGSNNIDDVAWYEDNSSSTTHQVGTKQPNELGIYDMSGNVFECCSDWYSGYSSLPQINPIGPSVGAWLVVRGGSAFHTTLSSRVSMRTVDAPGNRGLFPCSGFRLAHSAK